mgnify:FL=1
MNNYNGLTSKEVLESKKKYGTNEITTSKNNSFTSLLLESLADPIIKILLIALGIKIVFLFKNFDWFETLGILIAIFLASFISTISEYGSEKAFKKLQEESSKIKCKVKRENKIIEIPIDDVVKDDLVVLQYGDKIPADGILINGDVMVDESTINGEAKEVRKETVKNKITSKNKLYRGTVICEGSGILKVTYVGLNTLYGKIASELKEKTGDSPLKIRLRKLAKIISTFGYIGAFLASVSYLFSVIVVDNNFILQDIINTITNLPVMIEHIIYALTLSVTIIIVSVPEGLPMMITLVLSSNMKRMLKNNVLVRKLVGIETAGNVNILFSDKTGTLTTGKLKVTNIIDGSLNNYKNEKDILDKGLNYYNLLKVSMITNNMAVYSGKKIVGGNTTDRCLLEFFSDAEFNDIKKIKTIPFDSKNKYMITVLDDKKVRNLIKGAPEKLFSNCNYYYNNDLVKLPLKNKSLIKKKIDDYTKSGSRVILVATSSNINEKDFSNLTLVAVVVIKDEIRKEAKEALLMTKLAGVKTVMITGDNKDTALHIAKEVNLIENDNDIILTSDELNSMSDLEVKKIIPNLKVVARSLPHDKSRLVRLSKEMNLVVAMTGDGVNDAPALKRSDVGFAFGSGSEVAKEAGDIVILDDNFLSITKAILFGRTIFKSIRKFIIFQLTVNLCALSISIIGPFIGVDTPVTVIQMLWINMVMDTLAALAFSFEPALLEYMTEKPKKKDENIMNSYMLNEIIITGLYTTILCILFLKLPFIRNFFSSKESFMTAFFGLFIFAGIFNCFNARTSRINVLSHLTKNHMFIFIILFICVVQIIMIYYGGSMFRTIPLSLKEFLIMLAFSFTVVPVDVLRKIICKKYCKTRSV